MNVRPNIPKHKVTGYRVVLFREGCLEPCSLAFTSERLAEALAEQFRAWFPGEWYGVQATWILLN